MNKEELVEHLKKKGFSLSVIEAFGKVNREDFLPEHLKLYAYEDISLPLNDESSISQPSTISFMLELLNIKENQKILEIGSGTGYVLALISKISPSSDIFGLENNMKMAAESLRRFENEKNIHIFPKNGANGFPEKKPFERILISASCPDIATAYNLVDQLSPEGIMVAPVKDSIFQIKKSSAGIEKTEFPGFSFVPLKKD